MGIITKCPFWSVLSFHIIKVSLSGSDCIIYSFLVFSLLACSGGSVGRFAGSVSLTTASDSRHVCQMYGVEQKAESS